MNRDEEAFEAPNFWRKTMTFLHNRTIATTIVLSAAIWLAFVVAVAADTIRGDSLPIAVAADTIRPFLVSADYGHAVRAAAREHGVPTRLAFAVVTVESGWNAQARGAAGEIGLMQIRPSTARMIGYTGPTRGLYDPKTNLQWGMKYLAEAWRLAGGSTCGTILRYNAGHAARRMNPISARYCRRVKTILAEGYL